MSYIEGSTTTRKSYRHDTKPKPQRNWLIVQMRNGGESYKEIARQLRMAESTARRQYHRHKEKYSL